MRHTRIPALLLAGALSLSLLSACGGKNAAESVAPTPSGTPAPIESTALIASPIPSLSAAPTETPEEIPTPSLEASQPVSPSPSASASAAPAKTPAPTASPEPTATSKPTAAPKPTATPKPTLTPKPEETPQPTPTPTLPPTPTPAPVQTVPAMPNYVPALEPTPESAPTQELTPTPEPEPEAVSVSTLWSAVSGSVNQTGLMDLDSELLSALYGVDAADLEEFTAKIPAMNTVVNEVFLARVKSGKMDAVKKGVLQRQSDLLAQYQDYLPDQLELVKNYQLATSGDYILFCVGENAAGVVSAFQSALK